MDIILKKKYKRLGQLYDTVQVKPGYARNYLIPQGIAMLANVANKKMTQECIKQALHKADQIKQKALAITKQLNRLTVKIPAKVSESGKIFGAITALQISEILKLNKVEIDRTDITLNDKAIKALGTYTAVLNLHPEVSYEFTFKVVEA